MDCAPGATCSIPQTVRRTRRNRSIERPLAICLRGLGRGRGPSVSSALSRSYGVWRRAQSAFDLEKTCVLRVPSAKLKGRMRSLRGLQSGKRLHTERNGAGFFVRLSGLSSACVPCLNKEVNFVEGPPPETPAFHTRASAER